MKILYVEDNPANLSLLQRIARMGGHEVVSYTEGESALRNYEKDKPDLVLMDVQLSGGMNGLDVVRKLRERGHKTPIIAVTAYAMTGDRERCIEAGCDTYIAKPLPVAELVELVKVFEEKIKQGGSPASAAAAPKPAAAAPESAPPDLKEQPSPTVVAAPSAVPAPATPAAPAASSPAPTPTVTPPAPSAPSAPVTPAASPNAPVSTSPSADDKTTPASPMAGKSGTSTGTTPAGGTPTIASTVK